MVNVTELRLGNNLYESTGEVGTVIAGNRRLELSTECRGNVSLEECNPIPLTPEWLKRCGFEKKTNDEQIDGIEMTFHIDDSTYFSSCGGLNGSLAVLCLCRGNYFANNLQYLHQLQNLYFSLTGEELTINNETSGYE